MMVPFVKIMSALPAGVSDGALVGLDSNVWVGDAVLAGGMGDAGLAGGVAALQAVIEIIRKANAKA